MLMLMLQGLGFILVLFSMFGLKSDCAPASSEQTVVEVKDDRPLALRRVSEEET